LTAPCQYLFQPGAQQRGEPGTWIGGQLQAWSELYYLPFFQDQNIVGALDCAKPVSDYDPGAPAEQAADGIF
jgi:hypothetical protein